MVYAKIPKPKSESALFLVYSTVSDIEKKVREYHYEIEYVEEENVPFVRNIRHIRFVYEFGNNACYVAKENEAKEHKALTLGGSRLI